MARNHISSENARLKEFGAPHCHLITDTFVQFVAGFVTQKWLTGLKKKNGRENENGNGNGNEIVLTLFLMNQSEKKKYYMLISLT